MKTAVLFWIFALFVLLPSISFADKSPGVMVERYTFKEEWSTWGMTFYRFDIEQIELRADGSHETTLTQNWNMEVKDDQSAENFKKHAGRFLIRLSEEQMDRYNTSFVVKKLFQSSPGSDMWVADISPRQQSGEKRSVTQEGMTDVATAVAGEIVGGTVGKGPGGWMLQIPTLAEAATAMALAANAGDFVKLGTSYLSEATKLRFSPDPNLQSSAEAVEHLGYWLLAIGYQSMTALGPGREEVKERTNRWLADSPSPEKGTLLHLGDFLWTWDGASWKRNQ